MALGVEVVFFPLAGGHEVVAQARMVELVDLHEDERREHQ
jgi:hypothetical protein